MATFTNRSGDVLTIPLFEDVIQDFSVVQKRPPAGLFILGVNVPEQSRAALCQAFEALDGHKEYVTFAQADEAPLKLMVATRPEYDSDRRRLTVTLRDSDRSKYVFEVQAKQC